MEKRRLGKSGIVVSEICLGTMTFGTQADRTESFAIMDKSVENGINFFDTAEIYPAPPTEELAGLTEKWVGDWLSSQPRESVIIASKVAGAAHGWYDPPVRHGTTALDRCHIRKAIEGSLSRLKTDYIDLYQVHWPDHGMRATDTLEALDELVCEGKIRTIGLSNEDAYGLMKGLWTSELHNFSRYDTIQNNFSLNNRRFEDELAEVCRQESVSLLPYSPLAGGVLTGKYNGGAIPLGARFSEYLSGPERQQDMAQRFVNDRSLAATAAYLELAAEIGLHPVTLATTWSKQHDFVASTIIGVSSSEQLDPILESAGSTLEPSVLSKINRIHQEIPYPMG